jgi:hypothetical protein
MSDERETNMRLQAETEAMIRMREPRADWRKVIVLRERLAAKDAEIIALADALRALLIAIEMAGQLGQRIPVPLVDAAKRALGPYG